MAYDLWRRHVDIIQVITIFTKSYAEVNINRNARNNETRYEDKKISTWIRKTDKTKTYKLYKIPKTKKTEQYS